MSVHFRKCNGAILQSNEFEETEGESEEKKKEASQVKISPAHYCNGHATTCVEDGEGREEEPCLVDETLGNVNHLDDVFKVLGFGRFHIKMLLLACWGYFAVCAEMMLFIFLSDPVKKEWNVPDMVYPLFPVISGGGGILGGFAFGIVSDKFGRRVPFIVSSVILAVFGVASPFASSFPVFIMLRTFISIGEGGLEALVYVLLVEFLPRKNRGSYLVMITFCGALGAVFAGGMAWCLLASYGWKVYIGVCAVPAVVLVPISLLLTYETPRYLFISGQKEKALQILHEIARQNKKSLPDGEIEYEVSEHRGSMKDLFSPSLRGRTLVISCIWVLQCLGYWGVTMFMPEYMISLGIDPYLNMFLVFVGELPGLCLAMILIEPHMLGRIKCLRFFSLFTFICLIVFAFVNVVAIKSVVVVVSYFFMVPLYSILNTITPELYPTEVRTTAVAFVNILIEIPALATPFLSAGLLKTDILWLYPLVWSGCFLLQFGVTFFLRTETAGRNLIDSKQHNSPERTRIEY